MLETFSQYIYYLDIGLLIILGLFILGGLVAGFKKSLISFSLLIVLIVFLYLGLNPLSNLILDANVSRMGITSFRDAIIKGIINEVPEISSMMVEGTAVYNLVMGFTVTVMRPFIFFVGSVLIIFIVEPILRVIVKLILRVRLTRNRPKYRLLGAGVNFLKGVFILALIFFPIGGAIGLVKEIETVVMANNEQELALAPLSTSDSTSEYQGAFEVVELFEGLRVKKIINLTKYIFQKPIDEYLFNKTLMLKQDGKKLYLMEDMKQGLKIASIFLKYSEVEDFDIYSVSEEDLTTVVESLKEIKIIGVLLPAGIEIALNRDEVKLELEKLNIDTDDLLKLKWEEDFDILLDVGKEVILLGKLSEDAFLNLDTAKVRPIVEKLSSTSILQYGFSYGLEYLVSIEEVKPYLGDDFSFDLEGISLANELGILVDIYDQFKVIGFKDLKLEELLKDEDKFDAVITVVQKIASSDLLNQALPRFVESLVKEELSGNFADVINIVGVENIGEELQKLLNIIKDINKLKIDFGGDEGDVTNLKTEDVLALIDQIFDLNIFTEKELFRALFRELNIENADTYDFGEIDLDVEKEAIKEVVSKIVIFIKAANTTNFDDFINIIRNETNQNNLLSIIESASNSKVMVEVVLKLFNDTFLENMPSQLQNIIDLSQLPSARWRAESEKLLNIFIDINDANLFGEGEMTLTNELAIRIMSNIFDLELIKGHEEDIFNELLKMIPLKEGFTPDYTNINWDSEPDKIINILNVIAEIGDISNFDYDIINTLTAETISKLIKAINNSELLRPMLLNIIDEEVTSIGNWTTDWFNNQITTNVMAPISQWDAEIDILANLIVNIVGFDLNTFNIENASNEDIDKLGQILSNINHSRIFNIDNLPSILAVTDTNSVLYGADFTHLPADSAEWDEEITTLVIALKQLKVIKPIAIDKHQEIGTLLNIIQDSIILGPNLNLIVENALMQIDNKFGSYIDLSKIQDVDWVVELGVLNTLYNDFGEFTNEGFKLSSITGDKIESIMLTASNGELATQIFGELFNEQLTLILGENNPKDELGQLIYDYTDPVVLRDNASNIGKLIDFGNETLALYQNPSDEVQGVIVGNYIKSYQVLEGEARPTFADVYFPAILAYANGIENESPLAGIDMTTVDYEVEGQLFINFYQAETEIDKLQVLAEISNTSILTKAIMSSLGYSL